MIQASASALTLFWRLTLLKLPPHRNTVLPEDTNISSNSPGLYKLRCVKLNHGSQKVSLKFRAKNQRIELKAYWLTLNNQEIAKQHFENDAHISTPTRKYTCVCAWWKCLVNKWIWKPWPRYDDLLLFRIFVWNWITELWGWKGMKHIWLCMNLSDNNFIHLN